MSQTSPNEQTFTLTGLGLVAYVAAEAHDRIAAAADKAVWQMVGEANRETERVARRAVRRLRTPELAELVDRLHEENHRRDCARHGASERTSTLRLADALGPSGEWEARAREEFDFRAAEWVRGLMASLVDALEGADVEAFAAAVRTWRAAPESFHRYWQAWNHGSGTDDDEIALTGQAGWDYDVMAAEFLPTARRLRAEDRASAGVGNP